MENRVESNSAPVRPDQTPDDYPFGPQPPVMGIRNCPDRDDDDLLPHLSRVKRIAAHIAAVGFGLLLAAANLVVCPTIEMLVRDSDWEELPIFILTGAILAAGGLLSAGLVLLTGPFWLRGVSCWGIGLCYWGCWLLSLLLVNTFYSKSWNITEALQLGSLSLPLVALALQAPLWFARCYLGLRLVRQESHATNDSPLSIRDFFMATVIVAVSITFARLARPAHWPLENYWPGWAIAFSIFTGGSLLGVIPALLLIFAFRYAWFGFALLLLYGLIATAVIITIVETNKPGSFSTAEAFQLASLLVSLATFLGIGALLARACGYTLQFGRATR